MAIATEAFRRWFADTRAIDWVMLVIEFLVLLLIAAEMVHQICRHYRVSRITKALFDYADKGQKLQDAVPRDLNTNITIWDQNVKMWIMEVEKFIARECSPQATTRFRQFSLKPKITLLIPEGVEPTYRELDRRLESLAAIIEKSDAYL